MSSASPPPDRLGPECVDRRVVVRRRVPGETGPSGGSAMSDVLGVMESWEGGITSVRTADGRLVTIDIADIVAGKPVPPRPVRRPPHGGSPHSGG